MLAVCIIFLSSILFVFVATLYLEEHTFSTIITVFDGHSLLPFSRGERSRPCLLLLGREQSATCLQTVLVFSIIFSKIINEL